MQPYIIVTKAFTLLSLSIGRPSTMSVSLLNISFIWTPSVLTLFKYSGNLYALWVPNTIFTYGNSFKILSAIPSCCIIHPHIPIIRSGFFFFNFLRAPKLPKTLFSAFSLTQQVLNNIIPASSLFSVLVYPILLSIPESFSESSSFIWQPQVSI